MNLQDVQSTQAKFDTSFWNHSPGLETICHSERHIGKLMGKISTIAEAFDHGVEPDLSRLDEEVIPDLLIFAARRANERGINLSEAFVKRTEELKLRFSQAD